MRFAINRKLKSLTILALLIFCPLTSRSEVIDKIVAQVNDRIITLYDLQIYAPQRLKYIYAIENTKERDATLAAYYSDVRKEMIDMMVYEISALRYNQGVSDDEINSVLLALSQQNQLFRNTVSSILDREGKITPEVINIVKTYILNTKMHPFLSDRAVIHELDVRYYIQSNQNIDISTKKYELQLAFFDSLKDYEKFDNSFDKTVGSFTQTAESSGGAVVDMGYVPLDEIINSLSSVVAGMAEGEVSAPVTDAGGRVILAHVLNIKEEQGMISESLYTRVYELLFQEKIIKIFENWIRANKKSIVITEYNI